MEVEIRFSEVKIFLANLDDTTHLKVVRNLELLERLGNNIRYPQSKMLLNGIFELRMAGNIAVRILYTFYNNKAVILHCFIKKTGKTPKRELETAISRLKYLHSV